MNTSGGRIVREKDLYNIKATRRMMKPKRFRSAFTTDQINYLEQQYKKCPYIINVIRKQVAMVLNISERAIKIWFQNRRMKEKKEVTKKDLDDESNQPTTVEFGKGQLNNVCPSANDQHRYSLPLIREIDTKLEEGMITSNGHCKMMTRDIKNVKDGEIKKGNGQQKTKFSNGVHNSQNYLKRPSSNSESKTSVNLCKKSKSDNLNKLKSGDHLLPIKKQMKYTLQPSVVPLYPSSPHLYQISNYGQQNIEDDVMAPNSQKKLNKNMSHINNKQNVKYDENKLHYVNQHGHIKVDTIPAVHDPKYTIKFYPVEPSKELNTIGVRNNFISSNIGPLKQKSQSNADDKGKTPNLAKENVQDNLIDRHIQSNPAKSLPEQYRKLDTKYTIHQNMMPNFDRIKVEAHSEEYTRPEDLSFTKQNIHSAFEKDDTKPNKAANQRYLPVISAVPSFYVPPCFPTNGVYWNPVNFLPVFSSVGTTMTNTNQLGSMPVTKSNCNCNCHGKHSEHLYQPQVSGSKFTNVSYQNSSA